MFDPHLAVGQVLTEKEVHDVFECQTQLGIRMSKTNNLFVIMSGSAKKNAPYEDRWDGNTLHYNGTDINSDSAGNQMLTRGKGNNNSQLREVYEMPKGSKPQIFLFVKREANKCVYKGEVDLLKPYIAKRHNDPSRTVWIFPLKMRPLKKDANSIDFNDAVEKSSQLNPVILRNKALMVSKELQPDAATKKHITISSTYERSPDVAAYVKLRAKGRCDLCGCDAPFIDSNGKPYLETHHVKWLSKGGEDSIYNAVALCPNCHRKMHILSDDEDVLRLRMVIKEYEGEKPISV